MARAKTDPTRIDDASSNWLLIIEEVFLQWRDRLGSAKDAGQQLVNLLCDSETRSKIRWVDGSGEEDPRTVSFPEIEFWPGRLKLVPDPDGGLDGLRVDYGGDPYLALYDPDGHWEFYVRRRDVERWEGLYPALAAPELATVSKFSQPMIADHVKNYFNNTKHPTMDDCVSKWPHGSSARDRVRQQYRAEAKNREIPVKPGRRQNSAK